MALKKNKVVVIQLTREGLIKVTLSCIMGRIVGASVISSLTIIFIDPTLVSRRSIGLLYQRRTLNQTLNRLFIGFFSAAKCDSGSGADHGHLPRALAIVMFPVQQECDTIRKRLNCLAFPKIAGYHENVCRGTKVMVRKAKQVNVDIVFQPLACTGMKLTPTL